ncbi:MAG: amidohydrolase [Alphaproteobacteria bacterium]|nr:amidohydrolase [Alphaproteobacteria bacterium]
MLIVDAQVHIWAADTPERPWPGGRSTPHQPEPLTAEKLLGLMDAAGVDRAVIVPPSWEGDRNDLALAAAQRHPDRFAVMGRLPLEKPESRGLVEGWRQQPGMLGMRFTFHIPAHKAWLSDGTADWLWPAAERAGIPLMVLPPGSLPLIDRVAERHPGLRLVIDHLALSSRGAKDDAAFADLPNLLALARRPNVAVKATSLPSYSTEAYPYKGLHKYVRQVYDAFGPSRMFWGTDISRLPCSYAQAIAMFTEELAFLSDSDKEQIMGRAICDWLGWKI